MARMQHLTMMIAALVLTWAAAGETDPPDRVGSEPLTALGWMAGSWVHESDGLRSEELWTAPRGGLMLGLHRDVREGQRAWFEYLRIEQNDDGIFYVASPAGAEPTSFRMVESSAQRVVFANPEHDFPQRIAYWRSSDDVLHSRIEGPRGGRTASQQWSWRLVSP